MGDTIEHWRATIGQWSGGRPRMCVTSQHHIAQISNPIGYMHIRFLVLASLLVIGCVELNPGPDNETSAPTQNAGALPKFRRRPGTDGLHGEQYEVKTAAFLFARALNKTEEFQLASNVDGAGAFDDLVFRYRLRDPEVCKTCFIQLKHKKNGGTIQRSSLTQMSGDFSLFKYFKSFCEIKNKAATDRNLKQCGPFGDFEFVIYTNQKLESNSPLQGGDSGPLNILSSGTDYGRYITFDETRDKDIFGFFEELSVYHKLIGELDSLLKSRASVDKAINETIRKLQNSVTNQTILGKLNSLQAKVNTDIETTWIDELAKCDFNLFKEFLSKIKIFHSQSNEKSLMGLIEKELQDACKASRSVVNSIYTKFEEGLTNWWRRDGNVVWLNENSGLWQGVQKNIISEIMEISEHEIQEIVGCGILFSQQHVQKLSDAIKQNTVLNIVTNSSIHILQKLKTYQALNNLGYKNSLFIGIKSLMISLKEMHKLWPCKWSDVLVLDCDSDGKVVRKVLNILQQSFDCGQGLDNSDENTVETLIDVLQKYQQKLILISPRKKASGFQEILGNISYFKDICNISDLDENLQKKILERSVKFQGTNVALSTLVGTDPPDCIKALLDSDVISILLSSEHELSVGRQLDDHPKYYVPRVLQHQIYLKQDILKLTDKAITFAVSGLQAEELKKYLTPGEKLCGFVYDEKERNHTFKILSDFSKTGLSAECWTMKTHQKVGQNMKFGDVRYNKFWNKNAENDASEGSKINTFGIVAAFSKSVLSAELENMESYNQAGQNINPEEVRYIILGNKNPESEFKELKKLCRNVHWIHVEEGSFLWRDTNGNIDIIRRYFDITQCEKFNMKSVVQHNDRTMLLVAEPGMGKSTFLSHIEHEIKKWRPSVWVLRINLNEHTNDLENVKFEQGSIGKCKEFLWSAAHSLQQDALKVTKEIFLQALEQTGKMVIILDGFDEISPEYSRKVEIIIRAIRDETASQIWISSRLSHRQNLEDILGKIAFTLERFTTENQIQFLEQYWGEVTGISKQGNPQLFAKRLLSLCSQNFSDKDGEFTGIPLQTMMLGEAFVNEAKQYCCSGKFHLPGKLNLLSLFKKFTENKFDIYFSEKNKMDSSKPEVKKSKECYEKKHMISALISLFSLNEIKEPLWAINASDLEQTKEFLHSGRAQDFGIITDTTDGKPNFIHRCFAEYFAAKWFTDHFRECEEFISNILFNSANEVMRNVFDQMLADDSEIHGSVLNNDIDALNEILKKDTDINTLDKIGRTALHLAASYNSPSIQQLMSFPGIDANKPDAVLKWTPLRYAERMKSWMAMDILLQNGANPNDTVFTRHNDKDQEWGQAALWECATKGHTKLLEFMLNCGLQLNAHIEVPENLHEECTFLHRASYCGQVEVVRLIVNRGADINIRDANNNTALHYATESGSVDIINLLLDRGMSVNMTDIDDNTPLHVSAGFGHLEATKALVGRGAAINNTNKYGNTPLMSAAYSGKIEIFRYLTEIGADINIRDDDNNTALHYAAQSDSVDIIKLLLDKGMSVNLTDTDDNTPLHVSAEFGHLEAMKTLVGRGAAIDYTDKHGNAPLMRAASNGKLEIFLYLTEIGADINIPDDKNNTALHYAAESGSMEIIKLLLDKGLSVNLTDTDDNTPLHVAAEFGHLEATKTLVGRGAAINYTNKYGNTPLMRAASSGKLEFFLYLTEIGADINIRDAINNTALHYAAQSGSVGIIHVLLDKGMCVNLTNTYEFTPLIVSVIFGQLEATKSLVQRGAAINNTNKYGQTPLMVAAYNGKLEIFRYLTEIGADINIRDAGNNTALHYAADSGSVDITMLLLDKGMSVNLTDTYENTPLHVSAGFCHLEATKALLERGAAINITNKHGNTPLMSAAYSGKSEIFRYLTEIGADINIRDAKKNTALHYAADSGSVDITMLLLDKGMSVNLTDTDENTPLHVSAEFCHLEATKALLERGAAINITNKHGNTPLMSAAYSGKSEIFRYLTEIGADINICDADNNTALHFAAGSGSVDIIKLLLDKGMSVNLTNTNGVTPLHVSAAFGHLEATKTLVERGAAINITNKHVNTPLMSAAFCVKLENFSYLTEIGADINIRDDDDNNTALHSAAESGSVVIIKLLLDKGKSVNLTNTNNSTPLNVSAAFGLLEVKNALVERGIAINNTNEYGVTPLMLAAGNGKLEIFRYLTEIGADINILDAINNTVLHYAAASGSVDITHVLLDMGMCVNLTNTEYSTPLHVSAQFGNLEATKALVGKGVSLNNTNEYGATALMVAADVGKLEIFRYLTEIGADINICNAKHNNNTALHYAARSGSVDIITLLLDKGMSVKLTNTEQFTPLHFSALFGHLEATKALVERGAAINKANKYGSTPLILAASCNKLEIFRYLTEIGADINIHDDDKNTSLHYAAASNSVDIIELLLDKGMSINLTNTDESTPLHFSVLFGHLEATKALVERGVAINNLNEYGATALMVAADFGKLEIFRYLTEIGADINICNAKHNNNTALHYAARSGSVDIIELLLDKGMSVKLTNTDEFTPLHFSAQFGHLETTKALVKRGAAVNNADKYGSTPLILAASCVKLGIFRYLTEIGADINIHDDDKNTSLHYAAASNSVDIIELLLDKGMSVNLTNTDESTPLHFSALFGRLEATKTLVERGAAINNTNKYCVTPLILAESTGKLQISRYLTNRL